MPKELTLGSLFDGIGGWQIAAVRKGERQGSSRETEDSTRETGNGVNAYCTELGATTRLGGHFQENLSPTLRANMGDNQPAVFSVEGFDSYNSNSTGDKSATINARYQGNNGARVAEYWKDDQPQTVDTLTSRNAGGG